MSADDVAAKKREWHQCLSKGAGPGRCVKLEMEFRSMAKSDTTNHCIDETVGLMKCTSSSSAADGCGAAFLAMRECNRAGGAQLVTDAKGYAVAPGKASLFDAAAAKLTNSTPPVRSLEGMRDFGASYAKSLGITDVRF